MNSLSICGSFYECSYGVDLVLGLTDSQQTYADLLQREGNAQRVQVQTLPGKISPCPDGSNRVPLKNRDHPFSKSLRVDIFIYFTSLFITT